MIKLKSKDKRSARIIALQLIYANELAGSNIDTTSELMIDEEDFLSKDIIQYGKRLSTLVIDNGIETDKLIKDRSHNWDFNRIAIIDKLILKLALVEMIYIKDVPPKVSIAESVEIAKKYSTNDSSSFINGILDSVYNGVIINREKIQ
tara:strand:- start:111 stop:554 length:444 start_codon:yes stop_codon:yes gene_type:complete